MIKKSSNGVDGSAGSSSHGQDHVAQGDRHGIAAEDVEKTKHENSEKN
jgi:hypothetical protein